MTEKTAPKRTTRRPDPTTAVLGEIRAERKALPDEDRPLSGGLRPDRARLHYRREADRWAEIAFARSLADHSGWDAELLAVLNAAIAAADPAAARAGLIQVAALATAAVEHLDRASA
ncbi:MULTISPECIES: hypothetical protein [Streptomyces]|uniref:hypothetical protein n=1 Tax=Streptomyces TaxID=1883 RepID=UPI00226E04DA|nr:MULTISPECIES: hypothetical protein [unclassified Streptomyces]MCY0923284.1 hypothetical protein [Streptomyces sp. H27-G5]MCY0943973.1 hypothetical protein [Streptomyces sp. H34-AA3]MCY0956307.1 hypothetical protein [Streptomyces sp. H27-H5]MCZ4082327.1 hypothetical protein [Streptomyces sp. H34-S5]